ncbi:SCO family protein [Tabrizicola fusiformis]
MSRIQKALWIAAILASFVFAILKSGLWSEETPPTIESADFLPQFSLPDSSGKLRDSEEFRGRWLLVFFGFTNCPDVCPTTLAEAAQVLDDLGPQAASVQPVFISIDPERDLALGIDDYTAAFHSQILGLAGSPTATQAAADSFRIYFSREDDENAPDGYTMSHSPGLFLVAPDGQWLRQFAYGTSATEILADLKERF